jgi:hypothetical protein
MRKDEEEEDEGKRYNKTESIIHMNDIFTIRRRPENDNIKV